MLCSSGFSLIFFFMAAAFFLFASINSFVPKKNGCILEGGCSFFLAASTCFGDKVLGVCAGRVYQF